MGKSLNNLLDKNNVSHISKSPIINLVTLNGLQGVLERPVIIWKIVCVYV